MNAAPQRSIAAAERIALADRLDEARHLVGVAGMAMTDLQPDYRASALSTLLDLIDDKLSALSETLNPGDPA